MSERASERAGGQADERAGERASDRAGGQARERAGTYLIDRYIVWPGLTVWPHRGGPVYISTTRGTHCLYNSIVHCMLYHVFMTVCASLNYRGLLV